MAIVMIHLNVRVCSDNRLFEHVIRKRSLEYRKDSGETFAASASFRRLFIIRARSVHLIRLITLRSAEHLGIVFWMYEIKKAAI